MSSFTFDWCVVYCSPPLCAFIVLTESRPSRAQSSVYVTGTFDGWSKSTQLQLCDDGHYRATVHLPQTEKLVFKFVVDGVWTTSASFATEKDKDGMENNVAFPEAQDMHSETTSFTNISGEMSPFEQYDTDQMDEMDEEDVEDLCSSAQITLNGGGTSTPTRNLVSLAEGDRQVRYYTSMSLLSKFTKYFK